MMLGMSQGQLGDALGLTFQQVQKYERGTNRISASRLQHAAHILQVPPQFFFDGAPGEACINSQAPALSYVSEFLATSDGLTLARAFTRLPNAKLRGRIVALVEELADRCRLRSGLRGCPKDSTPAKNNARVSSLKAGSQAASVMEG